MKRKALDERIRCAFDISYETAITPLNYFLEKKLTFNNMINNRIRVERYGGFEIPFDLFYVGDECQQQILKDVCKYTRNRLVWNRIPMKSDIENTNDETEKKRLQDILDNFLKFIDEIDAIDKNDKSNIQKNYKAIVEKYKSYMYIRNFDKEYITLNFIMRAPNSNYEYYTDLSTKFLNFMECVDEDLSDVYTMEDVIRLHELYGLPYEHPVAIAILFLSNIMNKRQPELDVCSGIYYFNNYSKNQNN